jgi:transketolase
MASSAKTQQDCGTMLTRMPSLDSLIRDSKLRLLRMHFEAGVGHIGGNLSALDAMMVLHHRVMRPEDSFVLSKGHAAGALYTTLWSQGRLSEEELSTFHRDGSRLAGHPDAGWHPGIGFSTGSLGHGLPLSSGLALGKRLRGDPGRVYCLTSDGEWEEGSSWEALMFAVHQRLPNLVILIDANGLQGFGTTRSISSLEPLAERFRGFGVGAVEVDGHDAAALEAVLAKAAGEPVVVILRTVKGHGVSFMEGKFEWHYLPLDEELYRRAVEEVSG